MVDKRVIDTIIAEALGEGDPGMAMVAHSIINRSNNRGQTPLEVVSAGSQYSGYSNPGSSVKRSMSDPDVRARVEAIWEAAQSGASPDPLEGGEYFHTTDVSPSWATGKNSVNKYGTKRVGNHIVYLGGQAPRAIGPDQVPPRRPESGTALAAIESAIGAEPINSSATAYAPDSRRIVTEALMPRSAQSVGTGTALSVPPRLATDVQPRRAYEPQMQRIVAHDPSDVSRLELADQLGNYAKTYRPLLGSEQATNYVRPGVPGSMPPARSNVTGEGLNIRSVNTVPVNPDGSVGQQPRGNALQAALDRLAQRRAGSIRQGALQAAATSSPSGGDYPMSAANPVNARYLANLEETRNRQAMVQAAAPQGPQGRGGRRRLIAAAPQQVAQQEYPFNAFGYPPDATRLIPQPGLAPVPPRPPRAPGSLMAGASAAGLGAPFAAGLPNWAAPADPMVALNAPQPAPPQYGRVPPEQMTNPTAQEVVNGLGPTPTSAALDMIFSKGSQTVGQMNAGHRPILSFLAKLASGNNNSGRNAVATALSRRASGNDNGRLDLYDHYRSMGMTPPGGNGGNRYQASDGTRRIDIPDPRSVGGWTNMSDSRRSR